MAADRIKEVLAELSRELERAEDVDADVRETMRDLQQRVETLDQSEQAAAESMLDRVKELESKFAASHPVLERIARELVDAVAKMGI